MGKPMDPNWDFDDGFPKYIVKSFEIANENAPNVKLVYNHNGGMSVGKNNGNYYIYKV